MSAVLAEKPNPFPIRRRTGTAAFHLSKEAVDFGFEDLDKLTPFEAVKFVAKIIWGSFKEMPCPHCGTIDEHYWSLKELRWKCTCCGKRFSVTSGTVFANRRLPLVKILRIAFEWSSGASGVPVLQLQRKWSVSYRTVFTLIHKLREGLLRGHNTGMLCGVQEMDGMDVNGRGHKEKRNRIKKSSQAAGPSVPEHTLTDEAKAARAKERGETPIRTGKEGKTEGQHPDRRILLVLRVRGVSKGKGGAATRIGVAMTESGKSVTLMAKQFASSESIMMTDEDTSYAKFKEMFAGHQTVSHSVTYSLPDGTNNNQAESFNRRMKRAIRGIYLSASNKYLKDYAAEQAWREDTRRTPTGKKLAHLFRVAMGVGRSLWWRGYSQGHHRTDELLLDGPRPAEGRGKKVGAKGKLPR
jgi:transposase-like protein